MRLKEKLAEEAMLDAKPAWLLGYDDETSFHVIGKLLYQQGFEKARELAYENLCQFFEHGKSSYDLDFEIMHLGEKEEE